MNLLNYTKKLYDKINVYDNYIKQRGNNYAPFSKPINLTVIWVDDKHKKS